MSVQVRARGRWLTTIGPVSDLEWSERADGGCDAASWRMDLPVNFSDPALSAGARVDLYDGPTIIWSGRLSEPDRSGTSWAFHAAGLAKAAETTVALVDTDLSTNPHAVVTAAIARGALPWTYTGGLPDTPFVEQGESKFPHVKELLDAVAKTNGRRWGVGPGGDFYYATDPGSPVWAVTPGAGTIGVADDQFYTHLFGRYATGWTVDAEGKLVPDGHALAGASDLAAEARWMRRERFIDFTDTGATGAKALTMLQKMLTQSGARMGYTNGLELLQHQVTTIGGTICHLPLVRARQKYRLHGVLDEHGGVNVGASHDFVAGEVRHRAGSGVVSIFPVGLVDRDLESILSAPQREEQSPAWAQYL